MTTDTKIFNIVKKTASEFDFPEFVWVYCRPTVADLFKPDKRCGIYILRFRNNQFYVGQAVDVIRRFVQHAKVHDDIQEISFKTLLATELNKVEQELIKSLESKKVKLRNINLTSIPKGDTDLDLIIPLDEQQLWLQSNQITELNEHIPDEPDLQEKYSRKFHTLIKRQDFIESAKPFLIQYFKKCVLQPAQTELSFWSLTCLNKAFTDTNHIALCRLNFFWCEVLTIWVNDEKNISYTFHLTKSILTKAHLNSLKIKSLYNDDHFYQRGGPDQFLIEVTGLDDALKLLNDDKVIQAIKTFNLRQMQKGATVYGKYHCIDLAKLLLTEEKLPITFSRVDEKAPNKKPLS
jgi:hypothetical protein